MFCLYAMSSMTISRVTAQIMRNWVQHKDIADKPPSARSAELERMHRVQPIDALSRTEEGDDGHSILQKDMPDDEAYDCEPNKRRKLRYSPREIIFIGT